jgi:hypothetical protein
MRRSRYVLPATILAACALLRCSTARPFDRSTEPGGRPRPSATAGAVIISGQALSADPGLTVLDAIRRAMPQLRVTDWTSNHCPLLQLRGKDSVTGKSEPDVYVDGTRTADTCPLVTVQAAEARRIEVYPLGVTSRPGYPASGHGLILIFVERADTTGGG